ncbi:Rpn family recombination-promoting nuclease/putative transposase [Limosilactobacillus sp.]|jgi:predicted transposase/invertase (TIGR01784 family)|uniref:Rpn family recombination-promoting nuclease/putative transposase n=1 Tax=Limosilactobacillus sp. TaxID=2773925 RepID=UPI0025C5A946|nr:Rpn family recombination-promoting nuclease/putative transposase [Limosilactobacillus sp.]MCH3921342.1 Rpn family recombination-promoting nuclease/putative transposase [Limosilactobacillus sp.]MCH3928113.1 Rpn family recombination-promoting nuclease/putative transposase [Limosilactobacillus sp.]
MSSREQERRAAAAKWERLTLANDRMFGMVMEDEQICLQLLQQIFPELKIKSIQRVATQKQVNTTLGVKSPRFDVYVQDDQNRIYILEMQVKNNHNLPFRMRYYLNHADILKPGDKYDEQHVTPIYVIFFCDFDYYGDDEMFDEYEMRSVKNPDRSAGAEFYMVVFNAKATDFHDKMGVAGFLRLMHNERTPGDELAERIYQKMERIKHDPERRRSFMKYELDLMEARNEGQAIGLKKGREQGIESAVKMLISLRLDDETIVHKLMDAYNLSYEEAWHYLEQAR